MSCSFDPILEIGWCFCDGTIGAFIAESPRWRRGPSGVESITDAGVTALAWWVCGGRVFVWRTFVPETNQASGGSTTDQCGELVDRSTVEENVWWPVIEIGGRN